jgi:glyoxylase-like metal-dependent hydrolase (beta-lactamase superfamily II)
MSKKIEEIGKIWFPFHGADTYVYFLFSNKKCLLIDSGNSEAPKKYILPSLRKNGIDPGDIKFLVNTHAHIDHSGGNFFIKKISGALIMAHELDVHWIEDHKKQFQDRFQPYKKFYLITKEMEKAYFKDIGREVKVDRVLKEGDVVDFEDYTLRVIHTPGHSPGSISLYDEDKKILFTSDAVQGRGPSHQTIPLPLYENVKDYLNTLDKLSKLNVQTLFTAHHFAPFNKSVLDGAEMKQLLNASKSIVKKVDKIVYEFVGKGPKNLGEVAKYLWIKMGGNWQTPPNPHLLRLARAHLNNLEEKGLIVREKERWVREK